VNAGPGGERYVLLGLAPPRSGWFRELSQWTTSASLAAEFVKCVSAEEVRARLGSGRVHSALIVDLSTPAFDRDLVAAAGAAFTPVIAIDDTHGAGWSPADLGVAAVLDASFTLDELVDVLANHTRPIGRGDGLPPRLADEPAAVWRGQLVAVCGPGGTGTSTVAAALAQGLAADPRFGRRVLLADLALRAEQAMLHDAPDLGPGLQEVVEAHRLGRPTPDDLRQSTFDIPKRGYQLLLGLRRSAAWSALRPRAVEATVDGLRRAWQVVVADVTGDIEGEDDGGSSDVEERNALARTATAQADVVLVVGRPGLKGVYSLTSLVEALVAHGTDPARLLPVVNLAPRGPRGHAEVAGALARLLGPEAGVSNPVFVPERKVEEAFRDGVALPAAVCDPLVGGVRAILKRVADHPPADPQPVPIAPGSLGSWSEQDADAS
jgi:MinD-like ATPase involved in chromosome partitioning or flagellar assembly